MASVPLSIPQVVTPSLAGSLPSFRWLRHFFHRADLAMDLGTANTLIYMKGRGIVVNEPSIVAVDEATGAPLAVGQAAKQIFGKTRSSIRCVRPMKDGVIADFEMTALMIQHMLREAGVKKGPRKPLVVIGVPSGITQVEKRAVIDAAICSGAREVLLVEEPMAAALGSDLPIDRPVGNMIVDIGGGTTEVAIISLNATLYSHSVRVAGDEMDEAIQRHLRREHGIEVGIFEAERIKLILGSALPFSTPRSIEVFGRDTATSLPRKGTITDGEVRAALHDPVSAIVASVSAALEQTSAEVSQDIGTRGSYLAGGGALLKGLAERLERETGVKFYRTPDPLTCVVRGVGKIVENLRTLTPLCIS